jgi:hypothetical protein
LLLSPASESCHIQSLLFQSCLTALASNKSAIFVSHKRLSAIPPSVHRMPDMSSSDVVKGLRFVYPKNLRELTTYVSALGAVKLPDVLIVSGLESFVASVEVEAVDGEDQEEEEEGESCADTRAFMEDQVAYTESSKT